MDHEPLIPDKFEKVCCEDLGLLRFVGLLGREILDTNDPSHIACHLDHHVGEVELHREGIIEDQHPGIADGGPSGTDRPSGVYTGDIFLMGPDLVHLGDVESLEGIVEFLVGFRDGVDTLFQHGFASQSAEPYHTASEWRAARTFLRHEIRTYGFARSRVTNSRKRTSARFTRCRIGHGAPVNVDEKRESAMSYKNATESVCNILQSMPATRSSPFFLLAE